jgi:hypothetical protein
LRKITFLSDGFCSLFFIHDFLLNFFCYIHNLFDDEMVSVLACSVVDLRNKSRKPECVVSFNMGWWILVFYPEPEARDKIY